MMQVKTVDLLLTFKCPSKCSHCSYKAGPERTGCMKLADATRYLGELASTQPLQSMTVHGGEPFLYFEHLRRIVKTAKKFKIPERWVITNGYWANNKVTAKNKLSELKEAGLTCVTFSVDAFHQYFIPLDSVKKGIEAAASMEFERVCVDSYFLELNSESDNPYDGSTRNALENLENIDNVEFNTYQPRFVGRAADLYRYANPKPKLPNGKCRLPFWIGGNLESPRGAEIDYEGNVTLCPGICIGNAKAQSLPQMLRNYDVCEHPILSIIAGEGPIGLFRMATVKGFKQRHGFANECHLCYETRRFLRCYYPQYLTPANCY